MEMKRIQRKRTKGWTMPANTVSVTRPGDWGNPFKVGGWYLMGGGWSYLQALEGYQDERFTKIVSAAQAVEWYRRYLATMPKAKEKIRCDLRGKDLACWCRLDQPCHADILLEIANVE